MENILLPSKMSFRDGDLENESILTIEPLHHGYGTTVGNALRRVLLSSLEGAAVTAVKIKGANHEYSTIEGVKEDTLEIILNLKLLRLKVHTDEPIILNLEVTGRQGEVTAKDISGNADVEVVNSDLVIATMTDKSATFHAEITVGRGRGFVPTEEQNSTGNDIGVMAMDAFFSPVVNVGITVENTRVGEITNYDKVNMNILTDGTVSAQEAVGDAVKILLNHFNWIEGQLAHASLTEKIAAASEDAEEVIDETKEEVENISEEIEETEE